MSDCSPPRQRARKRARFGSDAYPDIWTKTAALLQSVVNNHALADGNKRLGWLAAAVFLELNGASVTAAPNDDVYELAMRVAAEEVSVEEIADLLRELSQHLAPLIGELTARRAGNPPRLRGGEGAE